MFEAYLVDPGVTALPVEGTSDTMIFRYRGLIERGIGRRYIWREGYSQSTADGGVLYPWMTKKECQTEAKRRGYKARFVLANESWI